MENSGLDEAQAGIKIAGRGINNLRYADNTTVNDRKQRGSKEPLDERGVLLARCPEHASAGPK